MKWKVLTGTAKEIESELNDLEKDWVISIVGCAATNDLTTVIVETRGSRESLRLAAQSSKPYDQGNLS